MQKSFSKKVKIWLLPFSLKFFSKRIFWYNLRHASEFSVPNLKSTFYGTETLPHPGPKIWDLIPKELSNLSVFQIKSGSLKIAIVDYVKNTFKVLGSFDTFSDILDLTFLVLKSLILFCIY